MLNDLYRILAGNIRVVLKEYGEVFIFPPTPLILLRAEEIYEETVDDARFSGIMTDDELCGVLVSRGLWAEAFQVELDSIPKRLEDLKVELYEAHIGFQPVNPIRATIQQERDKFAALSTKKSAFFAASAEAVGRLSKLSHILISCTHLPDGNYVWSTEDNADARDVANLIEVYNGSILDETEMRSLARHEKWRTYWTASKSEGSLFGKCALELTEQQLHLIAWSRFYDNIHESPDCPNDDVVEDDDMLDGWITYMNRQRQREKDVNAIDKNPRLAKASEVFYVGAGPGGVGLSPEEAKRVNAMNDQTAKSKKAQRTQLIKQRGAISEENLPDVRMTIGNQLDQMYKEKLRGRT